MKKSIDLKYHLLAFLVILVDASPAFMLAEFEIWLSFLVFLLIICLWQNRNIIPPTILSVISFVLFLGLYQSLRYGDGSLGFIDQPIRFLFIPFLVYLIFKESFFKYFVNVLYYISIITTPIWFLYSVSASFHAMLKTISITANNLNPYSLDYLSNGGSLLFYTVLDDYTDTLFGFVRNSGIFHEPGGYALYLLLAILLNTAISRNFFDKKNLVFTAVLLTTFSTTGYLLLFVFYGYAIYNSKMQLPYKISIYGFFIIASIYIYTESSLLNEKLSNQYGEQAIRAVGQTKDYGRIYVFRASLEQFVKYPLLGRGIQDVFSETYQTGQRTGWGAMNFLYRYGGLFGLFYLFMFYRGCKYFNQVYGMPKYYAIVVFVIVHMALSTQSFFFHASFSYFFIFGLYGKLRLRLHHPRMI